MSKERISGLVLLFGIVVSGGMALGGYRLGHDEMMACGVIGMIVLAVWAFVKPGAGSGYSSFDSDGAGGSGDGGGGGE
ncbi:MULTISPECIES: hypothetical protein [unclassified Roseovarius]|uniref:hypothetical protein n=1 Tax=unclassified Roseovarius TaxID=2614913 RepID=UPI00273FC4D2|nr:MULTISPECIES: hypothetical protein [unclassified Roseovarius]